MNIPYEKMPTDENTTSSMITLDGPIHVQEAPVRIRHYFVFSLFSALCLCPATGLIALAYSLKSSAKADVKFHDKARLYARRALLWNLISVILVVFFTALVLIFFYYVTQMTTVYSPMVMHDQVRVPNSNEMSTEINRMIQSLTNDE